jgi:hypothetical protein
MIDDETIALRSSVIGGKTSPRWRQQPVLAGFDLDGDMAEAMRPLNRRLCPRAEAGHRYQRTRRGGRGRSATNADR